jgi:hypothetical protein
MDSAGKLDLLMNTTRYYLAGNVLVALLNVCCCLQIVHEWELDAKLMTAHLNNNQAESKMMIACEYGWKDGHEV